MAEQTVGARRSMIARQATRLLRSDPKFREAVPYVASDGSRPIVVALLSDTVGAVFDRIELHYRDGANLLVGDEEKFIPIVVERRSKGAGEQMVGVDLHPDSPMGMFIAFLMIHPGEAVRTEVTRKYATELKVTPEVSTSG